ncbi:MAG: cysteine--tRNA ligase, partial [Treponema sp.]|nr:cysteine--tRNA ligase [Treponema sp.]
TLPSLIEAGYEPLDYRYFLLGGHYRSQLQFSYEALDGARNARKSLGDRIRALADRAGGIPAPAAETGGPELPAGSKAASYVEAFIRAMEDDLATPRALAELWGLLRDTALAPGEALAAALDMDRILGLGLAEEADKGREKQAEDPGFIREIEGLIAERTEAKKAKDFAKADQIRQNLKERGIMLEDGAGGTVWRRG